MSDDWDARPWLVAVVLLAYGALVAVPLAGPVNAAAWDRYGEATSAVVTGPMVEESLKALGVLALVWALRGTGEGARAGLAVGIGFGLGEAVRLYDDPGIFLVRLLALPMHGGAGVLGGLGSGLARQHGRWWLAPVGLPGAIVLHGTFNWFAIHDHVVAPFLVVLCGAAVIGLALTIPDPSDDDGPARGERMKAWR